MKTKAKIINRYVDPLPPGDLAAKGRLTRGKGIA